MNSLINVFRRQSKYCLINIFWRWIDNPLLVNVLGSLKAFPSKISLRTPLGVPSESADTLAERLTEMGDEDHICVVCLSSLEEEDEIREFSNFFHIFHDVPSLRIFSCAHNEWWFVDQITTYATHWGAYCSTIWWANAFLQTVLYIQHLASQFWQECFKQITRCTHFFFLNGNILDRWNQCSLVKLPVLMNLFAGAFFKAVQISRQQEWIVGFVIGYCFFFIRA